MTSIRAEKAIRAEREQQRLLYTLEHDRGHGPLVLRQAAHSYLFAQSSSWPWAFNLFRPTTRTRNLVKAGALALAAAEVSEQGSMNLRVSMDLAHSCTRKLGAEMETVEQLLRELENPGAPVYRGYTLRPGGGTEERQVTLIYDSRGAFVCHAPSVPAARKMIDEWQHAR